MLKDMASSMFEGVYKLLEGEEENVASMTIISEVSKDEDTNVDSSMFAIGDKHELKNALFAGLVELFEGDYEELRNCIDKFERVNTFNEKGKKSALFKGADGSMGLKYGNQYYLETRLDIRKRMFDSDIPLLMVKAWDINGKYVTECPYSSLDAMLSNWTVLNNE